MMPVQVYWKNNAILEYAWLDGRFMGHKKRMKFFLEKRQALATFAP